jgi:transposase
MRHLPMRPEEDAIVRARWAGGVRDTHIAEELGRSRSQVQRTRARLGLISNYGPGRPARTQEPS